MGGAARSGGRSLAIRAGVSEWSAAADAKAAAVDPQGIPPSRVCRSGDPGDDRLRHGRSAAVADLHQRAIPQGRLQRFAPARGRRLPVREPDRLQSVCERQGGRGRARRHRHPRVVRLQLEPASARQGAAGGRDRRLRARHPRSWRDRPPRRHRLCRPARRRPRRSGGRGAHPAPAGSHRSARSFLRWRLRSARGGALGNLFDRTVLLAPMLGPRAPTVPTVRLYLGAAVRAAHHRPVDPGALRHSRLRIIFPAWRSPSRPATRSGRRASTRSA